MTYTSWRTPRRLFDPLSKSVRFEVDAAADLDNHLVVPWYGPDSPLGEDALQIDSWLSPAWCNPPYGKGLGAWLDKFIEQAELGNSVVALLPAYVERLWWHEKVVKAGADIIFLVGRVAFERGDLVEGAKQPNQPRDPSALVLYGPTSTGRVGWLVWKKESSKNAKVVSDGDPNDQTQRADQEGGTGEGPVGPGKLPT